MILTTKHVFKLLIISLLILALFTPMQAYYSAYLHLFLFLSAFVVCTKEQKLTMGFLLGSICICLVFIFMCIVKDNGAIMSHIGLFLHYITWPILFVCVIKNFEPIEIKRLLYFIIILCMIGHILSIIQLAKNPNIARLLTGTHLAKYKNFYYKKGVGSYGYVYAMSFFTFGIVYWLKSAKNKYEKLFLAVFLILNFVFILYAAFTTAIVMAILAAVLALISDMKGWLRITLVILIALLLYTFATPILELFYNIAVKLDIEWVAKRFSQLLRAQETDSFESLKRFELYSISIQTFKEHPLTGGTAISGHSQILDTLGQYGILGGLLPLFLWWCKSLCSRFIKKIDLSLLTVMFIIFATIDTCSVMQIPAAIFFSIPLIAYMESEGNL